MILKVKLELNIASSLVHLLNQVRILISSVSVPIECFSIVMMNIHIRNEDREKKNVNQNLETDWPIVTWVMTTSRGKKIILPYNSWVHNYLSRDFCNWDYTSGPDYCYPSLFAMLIDHEQHMGICKTYISLKKWFSQSWHIYFPNRYSVGTSKPLQLVFNFTWLSDFSVRLGFRTYVDECKLDKIDHKSMSLLVKWQI